MLMKMTPVVCHVDFFGTKFDTLQQDILGRETCANEKDIFGTKFDTLQQDILGRETCANEKDTFVFHTSISETNFFCFRMYLKARE